MEALKHQLSHLQYIDTGERFLLIICRVVEEQPLLALLSGAAAAMLPILDFFQLDIQRKAVRAAAKALAAAAAATEKAVAAAAAETAARRHNLTCLPQEQRGATEFAPSTGTSGRKEGSDAGVGAGARSSSSRSKLVALREHLRQQLQLEKQQQRELLEQLDEYRSLINPTLPFFSSLLTYKDEALLQVCLGYCCCCVAARCVFSAATSVGCWSTLTSASRLILPAAGSMPELALNAKYFCLCQHCSSSICCCSCWPRISCCTR